MNEVNARRARLVPGWVSGWPSSGGCAISACNKTTRSTRPCIPTGSLNRASTSFGWGKGGNVTSVGWQVTLCDPTRHVSSRSGVATLLTAIHLLLTYLLTLCITANRLSLRGRKTGTTFLLWIYMLMRSVIWQNLLVLLLMNVIIDVTCIISGIYTNFRTFLCKKCDVGH